MSGGRLRIELGGRLFRSLLDEISLRFGTPEVDILDRTTVITTSMDQTGLRALLDLLWDGAADVHSVTRVCLPALKPPNEPPNRRREHQSVTRNGNAQEKDVSKSNAVRSA